MLSTSPTIRGAKIQDVGPIHRLEWSLPDHVESPGWHVIIGPNGAGKSSVLRGLSLCMLGETAGYSLRFSTDKMVRMGAIRSVVTIRTQASGTRSWASDKPPEAALSGFHAAFGPVRRFGSDSERHRLETSDPASARHASLFSDDWTLGDLVAWMKDLRLDEVEGLSGGTLLSWVKTFLNQPGLLPDGARFERVTSEGPRFIDPNGVELGVRALSDGYQSVIGLTLELLRQLLTAYPVANVLEPQPDGSIVVAMPGIVLIDEIDAHLHPSWQERIGRYFTTTFPQFQFIVTTHSPLVCRAAERGSIFRLPKPGTDDEGEMLEGQPLNRLLYGDVLDAYGTEIFGERVARGESGQDKFERLAALNVKLRLGTGLEPPEAVEHRELNALFSEEPL